MQWKTATVSYTSEKIKAEALKRFQKSGNTTLGANVEYDDAFERLTVLYSPEDIDIE